MGLTSTNLTELAPKATKCGEIMQNNCHSIQVGLAVQKLTNCCDR